MDRQDRPDPQDRRDCLERLEERQDRPVQREQWGQSELQEKQGHKASRVMSERQVRQGHADAEVEQAKMAPMEKMALRDHEDREGGVDRQDQRATRVMQERLVREDRVGDVVQPGQRDHKESRESKAYPARRLDRMAARPEAHLSLSSFGSIRTVASMLTFASLLHPVLLRDGRSSV